MDLYNSIIDKIDGMLGSSEPKRYKFDPDNTWEDVGGNQLVMMKESAYELGGDNKPAVNYACVTSGDYVTEDGKTIKVVDGKVAEIVDPEAEVATEEELASEVDEEVEMEDNTEVEIVDEPEEEKTVDTDERIAALEARLAEFTDGLNQIVNAIAALEERIGEVEGKLAKVEAPAADPIDEQPEVEEQEQKRSRLSYLRKD